VKMVGDRSAGPLPAAPRGVSCRELQPVPALVPEVARHHLAAAHAREVPERNVLFE